MEKILVLKIVVIIIFAGSLGSIITASDVYDDVQIKIVETLCLSCVKLKPILKGEYRFLDEEQHPEFILENLSKGPILLDFTQTYCPGCIDLEENVLSVVFNYTYPASDLFYIQREFNETNFNYIHINKDVVSRKSGYYKSFQIYDIVGDGGLPMIIFITYGYNHGIIEPMYLTLKTVGSGNYISDKKNIQIEVIDFINEAVDLYNQYKEAAE